MTHIESDGQWIFLNDIFLIVSSANVGRMRMKHKVNLGDGGNDEMLKAIRAQGNYIEYAPMALIGLAATALLGGGVMLINILGGAFLLARIAYFAEMGLGAFSKGRTLGTMLTMLTLLATAIALIFLAVT
ncbi:MAG: MAPEG family protein [Marinicaulis sp.]|nr:MAPEG family protein [Marinicaulis sp.]